MEELVSVIVPIYNVEKFLHRCIESVVNQSYKNLEIILVDDGSKDSCANICDEWVKKDKRINVIHKENGGLSDARNAGIEIATGKYLSFIDSDDYIHRDFIKVLYDLIKKHGADFSMCGSIQTNKDEDTTSKINNINEIIKDPKKILEKKDNIYCVAWNKLYKRELFDNVRYPKGKINEDIYAIRKILYYSKKIVVTDTVLYFYYLNEESIMRSTYTRKRLDAIDLLYEIYDFFCKVGEKVYAYNTLYDYINSILSQYYLCRTNKQEYKQIQRELMKKYKNVYKSVIKNVDMGFKNKIKYSVYRYLPQLSVIFMRRHIKE